MGRAMNAAAPDVADAASLEVALAHVLAAPRTRGPVRLLCVRSGPNQRTFPATLTLTCATGVVGDFEASQPWLVRPDGSPDPRNQVSLIGARVLDLVWRTRKPDLHPGDNLAVDLDLSHANLPTGTLLQVGTAILRVSDEPNDGCAKWKVRCGRDAYAWVRAGAHAGLRLRGLYCAVEQDGVVTLDDTVSPI
jgi:hypothetical protein